MLALAILLFVIGLILFGAEFFIPAHGLTAILGLLAIATSLVACFFVSAWMGLGALAFTALGLPVAGAALARALPYTWLGRHVVLQEAASRSTARCDVPPVLVGQTGIAISALRPSGVCEFEDLRSAKPTGEGAAGTAIRVEATSDFGNVAHGTRVRIICLSEGRAVVRAISDHADSTIT